MIKIHFWKLVSIGNDFPLVIASDLPETLPPGQLAIKICDRRYGVGGDGLLTLAKSGRDALHLRMFNPDGTEDFCGNGIRCAAELAHRQGLVGTNFTILHGPRTVTVECQADCIRTNIGFGSYVPADVPLRSDSPELFKSVVYQSPELTLNGSALTTGSTHVILPVSELPTPAEIARLGPKIENSPLFPTRTSVIWRKLIGPDRIAIRIWERGVGETLGCGTGSSAAALDLMRERESGGTLAVENPGGTVFVTAKSWQDEISVEGRARIVYDGEYLSETPTP